LAVVLKLYHLGFANLILRTHAELDLTHQSDMGTFFAVEKPRFVILAAAIVGGIHANNTYPADFITVKPRPPPNPSGAIASPPEHLGVDN
jgi:GDP-L-fucose synthase